MDKFIIQAPVKVDEFTADYYVYTDGSCSDNGSVNAKAGMGIYFGEGDARNRALLVEGKQTNNTAELGALIAVYKIIEEDIKAGKKIGIVSDSTYAIGCATTYGKTCSDKGWIKDIPNKEMVKEAYELYRNLTNVRFIHVRGHTGGQDIHSIGNDGADKLANQAIGLTSCPYAKETQVYLNVPFARKDEAKGLGARWDAAKKKWCIGGEHKNREVLVGMFG